MFLEVREAEGLFAPTYYEAEEEQLFYKLKRSQTPAPHELRWISSYATNVQDNMPSDAQPRHLNCRVYMFKHRGIVYEYTCQ